MQTELHTSVYIAKSKRKLSHLIHEATVRLFQESILTEQSVSPKRILEQQSEPRAWEIRVPF